MLSEHCDVPHIATGDILRAAVADQTELGQKAEQYMNAGELVPDALILNLIRERLTQPDAKDGWVLDGFPRNVPQAEFLEQLLDEINQPFDFVINLDVPDEVIIARLLKRGRKDDAEEVIRHRLDVYRQQTAPLIDFYRNRQKLVSIDGNQEMASVNADLRKVVEI